MSAQAELVGAEAAQLTMAVATVVEEWEGRVWLLGLLWGEWE